MAHGTTDAAEAQKFHDRLSRGNWWKPKEGTNRIRVMPPVEGATRWWHEWTLHWTVGPRRVVVPCLKEHGTGEDKQCAVCEEVERLRGIGDTESTESADKLAPQWTVMINIVDLKSPDLGVQPAPFCKTIVNGLVGYDVDEDYGGITHPEKGFDMKIERFAKGTQPLYDIKSARQPTPLANMGWLDEMKDVAEAFRVYTLGEQQAILRGKAVKTAPGGPSADDDDEKPAPQAPAPASKTAPATKPKCLGKDYIEDDPICSKCKSKEECKALAQGEAPAKEETKEAPEQPQPRCFGTMYDGRSTDCKECRHGAACKEAKASASA